MENYINKEVSDAPAKEVAEKIVGQIRTRVKKGETFWRISFYSSGVDIDRVVDIYDLYDNQSFESGNYFRTREEAIAMAEKFRKVLKGADVIEMPSENEMLGAIPIIDDPCDYVGPGRRLGWGECYNWLKSKCIR